MSEVAVSQDTRIPTNDLVDALFLVIDENDIKSSDKRKLKKKIRQNAKRGRLADMDLPPEWGWRICAAHLCMGKLFWWGWEARSDVIWDLCTVPWQYPRWDGRDCDLYLVAEQGIGDEIIFSNAYPHLLNQNPNTTIECDSRLIPAFERTFDTKFESRWRDRINDPLPLSVPRGTHDAFMPCGNALKLFIKKKEDFSQNWIKMDPQKTLSWKTYLEKYPKPHIGVSWVGRQGTLDPEIFDTNGTLFNLNYEGTEGFIRPDFEDFDDMWHFISALDRVDSVTNSTIHMSGSIGIPTNVIKTEAMYGEVNNRLQWQFGGLSKYFYPKMRVFQNTKEYQRATKKAVGHSPI